MSTTHPIDLAVAPFVAVVMTKRKAPAKASSTKKKSSKTRAIATPQRYRVSPTPSPPPIPRINLVDDDDPIFDDPIFDGVAVDNNPSPSPQYTVSYTVKLDEKTVEEDSKVYQLDEGVKSLVWRMWDLQQALAVKKYCDDRRYSYHKHSIQATINCLGGKKDSGTPVTLRGTADWASVEEHVKLWDSIKKKGITVTIRANWGRKAMEDYTTEEEEKEEEEEEKNKPKRQVYLCLSSLLFSSVFTNKYQRTATVKHGEDVDRHAIALDSMGYAPNVIVAQY